MENFRIITMTIMTEDKKKKINTENPEKLYIEKL